MPNIIVPAAALGLPEDRPADETTKTVLLAARRELRRIAEAAIELFDVIVLRARRHNHRTGVRRR